MMRKLESEIAKAQTTAIKYDDQELASVIESVNALREKSATH